MQLVSPIWSIPVKKPPCSLFTERQRQKCTHFCNRSSPYATWKEPHCYPRAYNARFVPSQGLMCWADRAGGCRPGCLLRRLIANVHATLFLFFCDDEARELTFRFQVPCCYDWLQKCISPNLLEHVQLPMCPIRFAETKWKGSCSRPTSFAAKRCTVLLCTYHRPRVVYKTEFSKIKWRTKRGRFESLVFENMSWSICNGCQAAGYKRNPVFPICAS